MMRSVFKATLMFLFLVLTACSTNRDKRMEIKTHEQAFQYFDDIKFGMFIHWGIYAVPAGRWNGEYVRGIGEWIMSQKKIPVTEYEKLAAQFNPVRFDADEWAQLAEDAGMRSEERR